MSVSTEQRCGGGIRGGIEWGPPDKPPTDPAWREIYDAWNAWADSWIDERVAIIRKHRGARMADRLDELDIKETT